MEREDVQPCQYLSYCRLQHHLAALCVCVETRRLPVMLCRHAIWHHYMCVCFCMFVCFLGSFLSRAVFTSYYSIYFVNSFP